MTDDDDEFRSTFSPQNNLGSPSGQVEAQAPNVPAALGRRFVERIGAANFNLYEYDQTAKTRVNRYLLERGKGIAQLTYFSLSLSTSLRGEKKQPQTQQDVNDSARVADTQKNKNFSGYKGIYDSPEPDFSIPWSLSLSFNFSQSQENPQQKFRTNCRTSSR